MKQRSAGGFSLIEVLVAMVLLAAVVIPTCTSLVMSFEMNSKADEMMQAQLAVSSAVESLMAEGIDPKLADAAIGHTEAKGKYDCFTYVEAADGTMTVQMGSADSFPGVNVVIDGTKSETGVYYNVTVSSDPSGDGEESLVSVTTTIRAKGDG